VAWRAPVHCAIAIRGLHSSTLQLNVSTFCAMCWSAWLYSMTKRLRLSKDVDKCKPLMAIPAVEVTHEPLRHLGQRRRRRRVLPHLPPCAFPRRRLQPHLARRRLRVPLAVPQRAHPARRPQPLLAGGSLRTNPLEPRSEHDLPGTGYLHRDSSYNKRKGEEKEIRFNVDRLLVLKTRAEIGA